MINKYISDEQYKQFERIDKKKIELKDLINNSSNKKTTIVELCGLPRTGKTSSIRRMYNFFKAGDLQVLCTKEPADIVKEEYDTKKISSKQFNDLTLDISIKQLQNLLNSKPDIILQDRGVFDNYIWYQMMYEKGIISKEEYERIFSQIQKAIDLSDVIYIMIASPEEIIKRDYLDNIYLESRTKTTIENINNLNKSIISLVKKIDNKKIKVLDTTKIKELDVAVILSSDIMDTIKSKYININNKIK